MEKLMEKLKGKTRELALIALLRVPETLKGKCYRNKSSFDTPRMKCSDRAYRFYHKRVMIGSNQT